MRSSPLDTRSCAICPRYMTVAVLTSGLRSTSLVKVVNMCVLPIIGKEWQLVGVTHCASHMDISAFIMFYVIQNTICVQGIMLMISEVLGSFLCFFQ